jgi:hypothetical protein
MSVSLVDDSPRRINVCFSVTCFFHLVHTKVWERCPLRKTRYLLDVHLEAADKRRFNLVDTKDWKRHQQWERISV